jgi:MinD-like ATPase involved in chromosome partitioning or flagellar assembly
VYVITFYSFKGGVGRTTALVNVAAELVRRGRKVLVVDFDLEAPGLETYKHLRPKEPHPGIVEYVTKFRQTQEVPDLSEYIYEGEPIGERGGRLWVMPAGRRDRAYRNALTDLDWKRLYQDEGGFLLFEDTKKGWEKELKPDYVLIDSRTGDTDVLGICTRQLPDAVMLMFMPNEQNLAGLQNVWQDIQRERTQGLKKAIWVHFVAANVPDLDDEQRALRRQLHNFLARLRIRWISGVIRRYENLTLLDQSIFTLDRPRTRLARSYRRLLRTLLIDNLTDRDGVMIFLERKARAITLTVENAVAFQEARKNRLFRIARHYYDDVEILNRVVTALIREHEYKSAMRVLDRVLELDPANGGAEFYKAFYQRRYVEADTASAGDWPEGE